MNYICIIAICFGLILLLAIIFRLNPQKSKIIAEDEELNKIAEKYPSNLEICKDILNMLGNENVKIEEDKNAKDCLYMVAFNKIIIAGTQNNFTRIQTIAHECIHAIQDKRTQMFNFVFSNICIFYFIIAIVLGLLKIVSDKMLFLNIYILLCFIQFIVRTYLENDAMIKAKFLAKEYIESKNESTQEEINKLIEGFEQINNMGIKGYNFSFAFGLFAKIVILAGIFAIL